MTSKKIFAIALSLLALAYVGLAYADDSESGDEQNTNQEQQGETDKKQKKKEWEQKREDAKQEWEQKREGLKQEWETAREAAKDIREKIKDEFALRLEEKKKLKEEFKEEFTEERCAKIEEKIAERTAHFDERKGKHQKIYNNLVNRVNKFITRFKAAGLTTTTLEGYLSELQTKIDKFKTDYVAYIAKLQESKSLTCGHAEGEFRAILVDARALLKIVHADAADIRTYIRTVIFPEIRVLKAQIPEEQDEESKGDDGASTN